MWNTFKVGIYARLSDEDKYKKSKNDDSESIINQKELLIQYVNENNYNLIDIYIDDGYSGTNFDRPEFQRMIKDAKSGRINMIITKDMSRLGRDYIETGKLIEKYFPEHGIRYVAVVDNIDTFIDGTNNDIAPFKAIMNDMYAKDISKKIRSTLTTLKKSGKYISGRPPFGYDLDPKDKKHLIINKEQAIIVKRIYDLFLSGLTFYNIARILTNEKVKTPSSYYEHKWNYKYNTGLLGWNAKTVKDILMNQIYIGDMVQNKRRKVNYKVKKIIRNDPKDYIVVKNTHDSIIDRDIFYNVQKLIPKNKGRNDKKEKHLLDGLLYCGDCGHRISVTSRRKSDNKCYTICNYYRTYMKLHLCTTHSNNYDILETIILNKLKDECKKYINEKKIMHNVKISNPKIEKNEKEKRKEYLEKEINRNILNLDNIYIDKINNKIDEQMYIRISMLFKENLNNLKKELKKLDEDILLCNNLNDFDERVQKYIKEFILMKSFSRELIVRLIDKIYIYQDNNIDIKLCFK